jgi:hypothetical protein
MRDFAVDLKLDDQPPGARAFLWASDPVAIVSSRIRVPQERVSLFLTYLEATV